MNVVARGRGKPELIEFDGWMRTVDGSFTRLQRTFSVRERSSGGSQAELWLVAGVNGGLMAAKVFPAAYDLRRAQQFYLEAEIGASLDHPNIMPTTAWGMVDRTRPALLMPYDEGTDMRHVLEHTLASLSGIERCQVVLNVMRQVLEGLCYLHGKRIAYRDCKPENIFLTAQGVCKLLDFGISKAPDRNLTADYGDPQKGTPYYMAPEQLEYSPSSEGLLPADVWGACITLLELLGLQHPLRLEEMPLGQQLQCLITYWRSEDLDLLSIEISSALNLSSGQEAALREIVYGCLQPQASTRWSIGQLLAAVSGLQQSFITAVPPPTSGVRLATSLDDDVTSPQTLRSVPSPTEALPTSSTWAVAPVIPVTALTTSSHTQNKPLSKVLIVVVAVLAVAAYVSTWIRVLDFLRSL